MDPNKSVYPCIPATFFLETQFSIYGSGMYGW